MRIGVIAEGPADVAVITNVLCGALGVSRHEVQPLRPELHLDETDLHARPPGSFSNWGLVREECRTGAKIAEFMNSPIDDGPRMVVVQIDTAEADLYEVQRPAKDKAALSRYTDELHAAVTAKMREWLDVRWHPVCRFAVAIEEIDAWVLTCWEPGRDSAEGMRPKERLERLWRAVEPLRERQQLAAMDRRSKYELFDALSRELRKGKLLRARVRDNLSLLRFVESLDAWRDEHVPPGP